MSNTPKRDEPATVLQHTNAAAEWAASEQRVPVFTVVKGDESIVYDMPAKPNPGIALDYLRRARRDSPDIAASWLIETAIGESGYDALVEELAAEDADLQATLQTIIGKIQSVVMGGLEAPKG